MKRHRRASSRQSSDCSSAFDANRDRVGRPRGIRKCEVSRTSAAALVQALPDAFDGLRQFHRARIGADRPGAQPTGVVATPPTCPHPDPRQPAVLGAKTRAGAGGRPSASHRQRGGGFSGWPPQRQACCRCRMRRRTAGRSSSGSGRRHAVPRRCRLRRPQAQASRSLPHAPPRSTADPQQGSHPFTDPPPTRSDGVASPEQPCPSRWRQPGSLLP